MSTLRLHLRVWWQIALTDAMLLLEYRTSFFFGVARHLVSFALTLFGFGVLYQFTDDVAGWSRAEALVVVGLFWTFNALWDLLLDGIWQVSPDVRHGSMDFILLRPVSAQFLLSLRKVWLLEALDVLLGLALVGYAGSLAGVHWSAGGVLTAVVLGLSGFTAIYALRFMLVTCAFWLVSVSNLHDVLQPVFQVGQYPVTFFKGWVRVLLSFVVPIAFAGTFPAQALLGTLDGRLVPAGLLIAGGALYASHRFFNFAVRHYTSASS